MWETLCLCMVSCLKIISIDNNSDPVFFLCPHYGGGGHLDLPLSILPSVRPSVRSLFVSHVAQKVNDLESWNLTGMLISMWNWATGYFHVDIFSIFRGIALDLVKIYNFQLVSHVTQKVFDLESWNLIRMLLSMCGCAPGYFRVDIFSIFRVIALDLVKISNFQFVLHVTQKIFYLDSWNLIGVLINMCSCAPGYFCVDIFSIFRVIALEFNLCCM
jgi:hypothetical protein